MTQSSWLIIRISPALKPERVEVILTALFIHEIALAYMDEYRYTISPKYSGRIMRYLREIEKMSVEIIPDAPAAPEIKTKKAAPKKVAAKLVRTHSRAHSLMRGKK